VRRNPSRALNQLSRLKYNPKVNCAKPERTMSRLIIADEQMRAKLGTADVPAMICTADGTVLGYFTPTPPQKLNLQPQISEEEMARRMADTTSPTYTTEEVIRYLKGLRCTE
jgi:hypothetical protein